MLLIGHLFLFNTVFERKILLKSFFAAIFCLCFFISSCQKSNDSEYKRMQQYLKSEYNYNVDGNIERVFYVNDIGCSSCVRTFSDFILYNVADENSLIIINSKGINVNLEEFRKKQEEMPRNVILSYNPNVKDGYFPNLSVLHINNLKVDTIIEVSAQNLQNLLRYIQQK